MAPISPILSFICFSYPLKTDFVFYKIEICKNESKKSIFHFVQTSFCVQHGCDLKLATHAPGKCLRGAILKKKMNFAREKISQTGGWGGSIGFHKTLFFSQKLKRPLFAVVKIKTYVHFCSKNHKVCTFVSKTTIFAFFCRKNHNICALLSRKSQHTRTLVERKKIGLHKSGIFFARVKLVVRMVHVTSRQFSHALPTTGWR